jgi:alkyl sulfatase BDS1-like metallo-beta-lactamase superfamily hydrolase
MQKICAPMLVAVATIVGAAAAVAQEPGSLNSPVRSQDPAVFNSDEVLSHLAPAIWEGENLAYTEEAPTIHPAQTAYARMMPRTIQEIVEGRLYHAFGFQLASTLIAVGDDGLILIDPGSDDDSARDTKAAFAEAVPAAADLPVIAVIYSHRHPDHAFGSAGWG